MLVAEAVNVREMLSESGSFGVEQIRLLEQAVSRGQANELRQVVRSLQDDVDAASRPADSKLLRLGAALYYLGRHAEAERYLARTGGDPAASYYHALVLLALERYRDAEAMLERASKQGYDAVDCDLLRAGAIRAAGRIAEAEQLLHGIARQAAKRAEYSYQMGCILADQGDTLGAVEYFERAADIDPRHSRSLFSLAVINSLYGNDREAIHFYERSLARPPHHLGALLNLGLLYEDNENYRAAAFCFRRVLDCVPNHERARLYLKDIEATADMYYDDESARIDARMRQVLDRSIADFELTVRSRNCLIGMNIHTLGDLTRATEQQLLAGKNFGETSLEEVRDLMAAHGLSIGQFLAPSTSRAFLYEKPDLSPEERALHEKSIADLNLSVRARKCMMRLGIGTVGELLQRSPDDLLGTKNFGVTSLNEIRAKLAELGVSLRND